MPPLTLSNLPRLVVVATLAADVAAAASALETRLQDLQTELEADPVRLRRLELEVLQAENAKTDATLEQHQATVSAISGELAALQER